MNIKNCLIIVILFTISAMPFYLSVSAQEEINVNIHMVGEVATTHFNNPVMVAGIWHFVNVTLEEQNFENLNIKFYKGTSMPASAARNESNYYEWEYDSNDNSWTDLKEYEGYSYLNIDKSKKIDNMYGFCLGVKDTWPNTPEYYYYSENWTLEIYKDASEIYTTEVVLEKPTIGLSKGHDDKLTFQVNPFSAGDQIQAFDDNMREMYFTIGNPGNIPLDIVVNYGTYNEIARVTNSGKKLSAQNTFDHYVIITSESWRPGILTIPGDVTGTIPDDLIILSTPFTFNNSYQTNAPVLEISVGHSNYQIESIPGSNIVFQYEKELEMNEGETKEITVYISGDGSVNFDVTGDEANIVVHKVSSGGQTKTTPFTIDSVNSSEYAISIQVEAIRENKVGIITYELIVDGKTQIYETRVTIGPPTKNETSEGNNIPTTTIFFAIIIIIVIVYMVLVQIRHRRR